MFNKIISNIFSFFSLQIFGYYDEELNEEYNNISVLQKSDHDCGIACLEMIFKWKKVSSINIIKWNEISSRKSPLWTIDLYCFLRENDIMSTMYTESIGISSSLYNINWYKDKIESDSILVNKKFELAENNVWKIENIIISMSTLIEKIEQGYKSIILVDNGILNQNTKGMDCTPYFGHYIFLLKFVKETDIFIYLDPASEGVKFVHKSILQAARSYKGTDHDIIIINP